MRCAATAAVLLLSLAAIVRCSVKTCDQGQLWARGRELLNAMKGQLVLVAFPHASDRATLQKLSSLAESHPSVRVIALLDPSSCSNEEAVVLGRDWRWLVVDRDDLSSRQRLGLKQGDVALFDRCGRLSRSLPLASTDDLNQAMKAALHHAHCGWCQYGTESGGEAGRVDKKLDAFFMQAIATQAPNQQRVYPHHQNQQHNQQQNQHRQNQEQYVHQNHMRPQHQHQPSYQQQNRQQQQQQQQQQHQQQVQGRQPQDPRQQEAYEEQLRQYHQRNQQLQPVPSYRNQQQSSSMGQTPDHITHSQIRQHEYAQRGMTVPTQTTNAPTTTQSADDYGDYEDVMKGPTTKTKEVDLRKPAFNEDAQWATASPFHQRRQHKDLFALPPPTAFSESTTNYESAARKAKPGTATTTAETKKDGGFEDYADYEDYGAMKTFTKNDEEEEEEATQMTRSTQSRPRSVDPRGYDPDGLDEDEVPCKAITDDICYHQKKSGRKLSKCCKKGIYLADFCMPGKCSNTTVQACCMQKYLQAKFQCCEDAEMDGTSATDAFSRCCHAHFVEEDDCCPPETAGEYWQSVHDICLPNVKADLTTVRLEIRLSDGIRVVDLAEPDKWQHECRYGGRRAQYVYVP